MTEKEMSGVADLIARLERATGPDRDIDLDIARITDTVVMRYEPESKGNVEWTHHEYTESLDSALSLVPEGCTIYMTLREAGPLKYWACTPPHGLGGPQSSKKRRHLEGGSNATAAIALCIAALKATQSISGTPDPATPRD